MKPISFLLVDDLEENLIALEGLLRRDGLQLLKANSGDQALELLLEHDVALALVDVQMPGLDGFQLAELMRGNERTRHVPIIFVTAGSAGQRRFQGYEAGAVDFIQKPIEPDILRSKAEVFYELYRQRQQLASQRDELAAQAQALREAAQQKDILLQEINHRIKNLFGLTSGLISLSARSAETIEDLVADLRSRLQALARAHELTLPVLGKNNPADRATSVVALIEAIVAPHKGEQRSPVKITGTDVAVSGNGLTSFALLLHELTTNSAKYGALSSPEGQLAINIGLDDELLSLNWKETGGKIQQQPPERKGFGATLEKATVQGLNAVIARDWQPEGLSLSLKIPAERLVYRDSHAN
ncbi:response regulator [Brucella pseudogrignonensis]|uniref:response regulator n=1 Tax=Brucella pseudogrignonensis TaxID=419475 RepID=UPI0002BA27B6|nr:response regulator [Brucella pseudogrignonensis]EMG51936.1 signal transduction histidine kinase [Ochrobactrum sp. CDB2]MQP42540.1 response regulator [Ochrobactrum sp. MYb237]PQZ39153.1 histidine kinase [Brucella pseudogrignonensis]PRA37215.1 histidine kinase [Brucella pseudogrignonensis]PRA62864.1 histidine kinase [Brucella pseudogrignonensis]